MSKAEETRIMILQKSFELIYRKGYQSTSIDEIIATTAVTTGAFFYHFKSKEEMGLALITDFLYPGMHNAMIKPLRQGADPLADIYMMMEGLLIKNNFFNVEYGCPAINLTEEMAPLNPAFKKALAKLVIEWQKAIVDTLHRARTNKITKTSFVADEAALVVITGYGGIRGVGKLMGKASYRTYLKALKAYLASL
jgi:TetR/AcrR family transcriptional repressor of nem operon